MEGTIIKERSLGAIARAGTAAMKAARPGSRDGLARLRTAHEEQSGNEKQRAR